MNESAYYNENDPHAAAWLRELIKAGHIAPGVVDERSIVDVQPADLVPYRQCHFFAGIGGWSLALRSARWSDDAEVWTGSCPCQPFSNSGDKEVDNDCRDLWPAFRTLIEKRKPPIVFGEQIASANGRIWLARARLHLEAMGYAVGGSDLCSAGVGAPDIRQRLYWGAYRDGERQPQSRQCRQDAGYHSQDAFREADRLVDAVRRRALPFLCRSHARIPESVGRVAVSGFGNAICPPLAAQFIQAFTEAIEGVNS